MTHGELLVGDALLGERETFLVLSSLRSPSGWQQSLLFLRVMDGGTHVYSSTISINNEIRASLRLIRRAKVPVFVPTRGDTIK